jgi:hypothetical protein
MAMLLKDNMEAINRYFMEGKVRTAAAEKVKQEWMRYWKDTKRDWTYYNQEEYDQARNIKHKFDLANATSSAERTHVAFVQATGMTSEEMKGETRRAGTKGDYLVDPQPLVPTSWKFGAIVGVALIGVGVFGKQLLKLTPLGRLARILS